MKKGISDIIPVLMITIALIVSVTYSWNQFKENQDLKKELYESKKTEQNLKRELALQHGVISFNDLPYNASKTINLTLRQQLVTKFKEYLEEKGESSHTELSLLKDNRYGWMWKATVWCGCSKSAGKEILHVYLDPFKGKFVRIEYEHPAMDYLYDRWVHPPAESLNVSYLPQGFK